MQTGCSQDQVPHMWDLILASACLHLYKNTDKSVSRIEWETILIFLILKTLWEMEYLLLRSNCTVFHCAIRNSMHKMCTGICVCMLYMR